VISGRLVPPDYRDVIAAAARLEGHVHRTPVLRSRRVNERFDADIVVKCENFQRAGAFKFRGAFNAIAQFDRGQRARGVVAYSSGNHAQAVALSARLLKVPATVVMPFDAPASKIAATRGYGADVITYDRFTQDREQIGQGLTQERGATLIPPYDHPDVIAGQGTATKELFEEVGELDVLVVPLGGGGLLAGACLAARALSPGCQVYGVEPEVGNDGQQSLRANEIVHIDTPATIADGAQTQHLGQWTFNIIRHLVRDIVTVSDQQLIGSMRTLTATMKLVVEPTGCLGFTALDQVPIGGKRVGVLLSGGNVDLDRFANLLTAGATA